LVWAQSTDIRRIGVFTPGGSLTPVLEGMRDGLAQLGYVEGKQISLIIEDTKMSTRDPVKAALQLLQSKPHVIVAATTANTAAAKQVAGNIPIVFAMVTNPDREGFVAGYASSKNNLTGVSVDTARLSGKRLELLRAMVPGIKRVLVVVATKENSSQVSYKVVEETAKNIGVQLVRRTVDNKTEFDKALIDTPKGTVDAIIHVPSNLVRNYIADLIDKANKDKLPLSVHEESMVHLGALVSYGPDLRSIGVQTAKIVARVLSGTKPSEIPIETPERPALVVNRTTAKTIGLKISPKFLELVDEVVD
jgi:putative ABC transport system substrate-binding protein